MAFGDDLTRRMFLRILGGAAATPAINPLLKVIAANMPEAASTFTPDQTKAMEIMQALRQARSQGVDRFPVIYDALKDLGIDFDNVYDRTHLPEGMTFKDKPLYGRSELHNEANAEQAFYMDAAGSFNPNEPQPFPRDAHDLGRYLDINLPENYGEILGQSIPTKDSIQEAWTARLEAARAEDAKLPSPYRSGHPSHKNVDAIFAEDDAADRMRQTQAFMDRSDALEQHLYANHPFYQSYREDEAAQAARARKQEQMELDIKKANPGEALNPTFPGDVRIPFSEHLKTAANILPIGRGANMVRTLMKRMLGKKPKVPQLTDQRQAPMSIEPRVEERVTVPRKEP